MMLLEKLKDFSAKNGYEVIEEYQAWDGKAVACKASSDKNGVMLLKELTDYLESVEYDDPEFELEDCYIDDVDDATIVVFPFARK